MSRPPRINLAAELLARGPAGAASKGRRSFVAAAGALLVLVAACSTNEGSTATPGVEAPTETLAPFEIDEAGTGSLEGGGCAGTGNEAGGGTPASAGSPLAAPGARQLPGPSATVTSVPSSATSIVVQTPGNPDEASPARQPDRSGTPTEPYVIGAASTAEDSSATTTSVATPDEPVTDCGGGL